MRARVLAPLAVGALLLAFFAPHSTTHTTVYRTRTHTVTVTVPAPVPTVVTTPLGLCPQEDSCAADYHGGQWHIAPVAH